MIADKPVARMVSATCETPFYRNTTCDGCVPSPCGGNTPRCVYVQTSNLAGGSGANNTECLADCQTKPVRSIVQACPNGKDYLGTVNTCCNTFLETAVPVCSTEATLLGSTAFKNWVTKASLFGNNLVSALIVAILLCMGIFVAWFSLTFIN